MPELSLEFLHQSSGTLSEGSYYLVEPSTLFGEELWEEQVADQLEDGDCEAIKVNLPDEQAEEVFCLVINGPAAPANFLVRLLEGLELATISTDTGYLLVVPVRMAEMFQYEYPDQTLSEYLEETRDKGILLNFDREVTPAMVDNTLLLDNYQLVLPNDPLPANSSLINQDDSSEELPAPLKELREGDRSINQLSRSSDEEDDLPELVSDESPKKPVVRRLFEDDEQIDSEDSLVDNLLEELQSHQPTSQAAPIKRSTSSMFEQLLNRFMTDYQNEGSAEEEYIPPALPEEVWGDLWHEEGDDQEDDSYLANID